MADYSGQMATQNVMKGDPGDFLMSVIVEHWQQFLTDFYEILAVVIFL